MRNFIEKTVQHIIPSCLRSAFILVLLLSFSSFVYAEYPLKQELIGAEELYIGTPFTLSITITTPGTLEINYPVIDTTDVFSIIDIKTSVTEKEGDRDHTFQYVMAAFDVGEQRIPPLTFEIFNPDDHSSEMIKSQPVHVSIISVVADTSRVLKDIAPPVKVRYGFWDYATLFGIILLIVAIAYLIWYKFVKKSALVPVIEQEDSMPAHQKALILLYELRERKLLEKGDYLTYYFQLSYIIRYFWSLQYSFQAVEMTSTEIVSYFKRLHISELQEIIKFLRDTDLVKFAKQVTTVPQALELAKWLEDYLRSFEKQINIDTTPESRNV